MRHIVLLVTGLAHGLPVSSGEDTPPPTIEKLIEQLGSRSFAEREKATKALRDRGAAALPAVRKALESKDEEVRKRAESLVPVLEVEEALLPKRVTLKADGQAISAVLADLEKQTGYKFRSVGGRNDEKVTTDLRNVPFWEAIDSVLTQTGRGAVYQPYDKSLQLTAGVARSPFVSVRGPFRLEANWIHEDRDVDFTQVGTTKDGRRGNQLTLSVALQAEPRLTFLRIGPAKIEEAMDSDGKSLLEPKGPGPATATSPPGRGTFRGESLQYTDVRLRRASETAKSLKVVRGMIPVKTILIRRNVVVTTKVLESAGTKFRAGSDGLEITRVDNQGGGSLSVEIAVPQHDGNRNIQWYERFHVEDDAGNKFQSHGSGSRSTGTQWWISIYCGPPFNKKNVGPPTKLVFEDWVIHDHEIPFEFKDVPLP